MARYIDADIAIEEIDKLQESLMSNNDTIWKKNKPIYKGLCNARGIINDTPTADVVPKSEVEILKSLITHKEEEAYNKGYEDGKADSIKELFESFYEICKGIFFTPTSYTLWQEFKKKYTEGE